MAACALTSSRIAPLAHQFRNKAPLRRAALVSVTATYSKVDPQAPTSSRRRVLAAAITALGAVSAAPKPVYAKNVSDAKRERDARKRAVREAAAQSREGGSYVDTGMTSDYSLPEGAQRGRNSRTVPQKSAD